MDKRIFVLLLFLFVGCQDNSGELEWHQEDGYRWAGPDAPAAEVAKNMYY